MIVTIFGTTAELIKLAPVLVRLDEAGQRPFIACTGQHPEQIPDLMRQFGLGEPDLWLGHGAGGKDLRQLSEMPGWAATVLMRAARNRTTMREALARGPGRPLVMIHSDTITSVIGALIGRSLGATLAHVESGYRTGNWRNPFPEELDRRFAESLSHIRFAAGPEQAANIEGVRSEVVDTGANTVLDALDLVPADAVGVDTPDEPFGVVTLHRFELLEQDELVRDTFRALSVAAAKHHPLLWVEHPITAATVDRLGLDDVFHERFVRVPRQLYFPFIALKKASGFVITDSGGSQQECTYLGHPCLVHRATTETALGPSVRLSGFDLDVLRDFMRDPLSLKSAPVRPERAPSDIVVDALRERDFVV